jgi:hypothetical protein
MKVKTARMPARYRLTIPLTIAGEPALSAA